MLDDAPVALRDSFRRFNDGGGKFRLAVINACNLDCAFCHNEAMANPRRGGVRRDVLGVDDLVAIASAWARLGGAQINLTGGEPLALPELVPLIEAIDKRATRIALNSNVLLAERLLRRPRVAAIDVILASLHTLDDATWRDQLGGRRARDATDAIVALARHGYRVDLNYSLGPANRDHFDDVLDFALAHDLHLKAIALVRSSTAPGFYGGDWVDPAWLAARLDARGAACEGSRDSFGGRRTTYRIGRCKIEVKNIAAGRLHTDFCRGCLHQAQCGEGIYGLRTGVDGLLKPCLLRRDRHRPIEPRGDLERQLLDAVHAMVGDWSSARFVGGAPG
ncbi:MAG: radical SAM protein [Myxococcales bacterium]|nr:radical SAM protein [Myxococcales bacterium]